MKQDLNFSTEDIIEENTLNVGPQHNLGTSLNCTLVINDCYVSFITEKELPKQIEAIQKTVPQAKTVNDSKSIVRACLHFTYVCFNISEY